MAISRPKLVLGTARAYGLRWFVVHRGNKVQWPAGIADNPALQAGSLKLYDFK
jgi:hypothetical protein